MSTRSVESDPNELFIDALTNVLAGIIFMTLLLTLFTPTTQLEDLTNDQQHLSKSDSQITESSKLAYIDRRQAALKAISDFEAMFDEDGLSTFADEILRRLSSLETREFHANTLLDKIDQNRSELSGLIEAIEKEQNTLQQEVSTLLIQESEIRESNTIRARLPMAKTLPNFDQVLIFISDSGTYHLYSRSLVTSALGLSAGRSAVITLDEQSKVKRTNSTDGRSAQFNCVGPGLDLRSAINLLMAHHDARRYQVDFVFGPNGITFYQSIRARTVVEGFHFGFIPYGDTHVNGVYLLGYGTGPDSM